MSDSVNYCSGVELPPSVSESQFPSALLTANVVLRIETLQRESCFSNRQIFRSGPLSRNAFLPYIFIAMAALSSNWSQKTTVNHRV